MRQAEALDQAAGRTRIATVSLSVSAAAVAALGVVLVVVGVRKPRHLEVLLAVTLASALHDRVASRGFWRTQTAQ